MNNLSTELLDLCKSYQVDPALLSELLKVEKSNLSSKRGGSHKTTLEQIIKKHLSNKQ